MTIQEWKTKINSYFQPKTTAERQKMMKYLVVFPAAILSEQGRKQDRRRFQYRDTGR